MWFQSFQDDVCRYLKDDIGHEEDGQRSVEVVPHKLEILQKTVNGSIGDVDSAAHERIP